MSGEAQVKFHGEASGQGLENATGTGITEGLRNSRFGCVDGAD